MNKRAPNPIDVHVGMRIRMRRLLLGISQEKLAQTLGLTFQQVQKYEKGLNRVSASRLYQITKALNESVSFFFDGLPMTEGIPARQMREYGLQQIAEEPPENIMTDFLNTSDGVKLNRAFVSIRDPAIRKNVIELVRSLAKEGENK